MRVQPVASSRPSRGDLVVEREGGRPDRGEEDRHVEEVVQTRRPQIPQARLDDGHQDAPGLELADRHAERAKRLDTGDLEVGEVLAVVHAPAGVRLGVAHAQARRVTSS